MCITFNINNGLFLASSIAEVLPPNISHTSHDVHVQVCVCISGVFCVGILFIFSCKILEAVIVYFLDMCGQPHELPCSVSSKTQCGSDYLMTLR